MDLQRAEALLSALCDDAGVIGSITIDRCDAITAWLRGLHFERRPAPNLAIPRVEAALAIASVWAERGKYRSALRLVEAIEPDLAEAELAIHVEQVQLFEAELRLEAGQVERARARVASIEPAEDAVDWVRRALVRARISLTAGRLRDAYDEIRRSGGAMRCNVDPVRGAQRASYLITGRVWPRPQFCTGQRSDAGSLALGRRQIGVRTRCSRRAARASPPPMRHSGSPGPLRRARPSRAARSQRCRALRALLRSVRDSMRSCPGRGDAARRRRTRLADAAPATP
jgi:hypothetical protein